MSEKDANDKWNQAVRDPKAGSKFGIQKGQCGVPLLSASVRVESWPTAP